MGGPVLIVLAALVAALAPAHAMDGDIGDLPWRIGGRVGFTVDAVSAPGDGEEHDLRVFVRIPPATLAMLTTGEDGRARVALTARLRRAYGGKALEWGQSIDIRPGLETEGLGKVVAIPFQAKPGLHRLEVRMEDDLSRKRGLIYMGRNVRESGEVKGEIRVPGAQAGRDVSTIEFVWSRGATQGPSAFQRGERYVIPNAERLYGRYEPTLRAGFVARAGEGDARPWRWVARLIDREQRTLAKADSVAGASRRLDAEFSFDLRGLPAGGYDVEVKAWQEGDSGAVLVRSHFSIAWKNNAWISNPRDIEDSVHFLLGPDEEEAFARLQPGEQERYMDDFWLRRDPDPETPENEARDRYFARIDYANQNFSRAGIGKGMFTDRGRVYIRYGEPYEVLYQVIPAGDETLSQIIYEISATEDRSPANVLRRGPGGDMRPFEVWIYQGEIPLPPDADPSLEGVSRRHRLLFLFVDEQGLGHYTLRYSTE